MARGAALARCRVTDPLQIDSHTVPSQHTCHVRWRGLSEVRRKLHVLRAFVAAAAATAAAAPTAPLLPTRPAFRAATTFLRNLESPFSCLWRTQEAMEPQGPWLWPHHMEDSTPGD